MIFYPKKIKLLLFQERNPRFPLIASSGAPSAPLLCPHPRLVSATLNTRESDPRSTRTRRAEKAPAYPGHKFALALGFLFIDLTTFNFKIILRIVIRVEEPFDTQLGSFLKSMRLVPKAVGTCLFVKWVNNRNADI